ncbi:MAG: alpha/beta hydrolase [Proteobacteria bacterium]|nr:alpha/beta hydrolase [Pseudomonadota bacterium]
MRKLGHLFGFPLLSLLLCVMTGLSPTLTSAAMAPPKINLDEFDRSKQTVQLPNGITLGYVDIGPRTGRPVVLIHGYTDNARDWVPLLPYLDKSIRTILVDIRGHGLSSKPECCYTRIDFAYDIRLLLDRLDIRDADIVGHSLGSLIAQTFAEYWPERTHRLVLVSSTGGPHAACPAGDTKPMDFASEIVKLKDPIDPESPWMLEWWSSPTPVDADFLRRQRIDSARIPAKVWLAVLQQGLSGNDLQGTLPWIKAPTLLIWGGKDPIFVDKDRCSLIKALPTAEVKIFAELGHNPFWEEPLAFAGVLQAFLRAEH